MYLDDVTPGGTNEDIVQDLVHVKALEGIGLCLNNGKSA